MHLKPKSYIILFSLLCLLMLPTPLKAQIEPPPVFSKSFAPATIVEGGTSTLTFVIDNTASALDATALDFTDNLPAGVVVATPANASTTCTGGTLTAASGTGVIAYTGGTVGAGVTCTVTVDVTSSTAGVHVNTTGDLTSSAGNSGPASDTLTVNALFTLVKSFTDDPVAPGGTVTLAFTITNLGSTDDATALTFTDDLDATLSGLVATGLPMANVCGAGSTLVGASLLVLTGGNLAAGVSCIFSVTLQVPAGAAPNSYRNTTSNLMGDVGGLPVTAVPAVDDLTIEPPPTFSKTFAPATINEGGASTLTFTIDNTVSALVATGLDFTDNLPAGVVVATPSNAATTCTGGTLTAASGTGVIAYTGGTVAAGATCTVAVDVTGTTGTHVNTSGDLTSSAGNSGTASDTLTVDALPDNGGDRDRDDDDDDSPVPPPAAASTQRFNCWPWEIIVPTLTVPHAGVICQPSLGTPLPAPSTFRYLGHSTEVTITDAAGTPLTQFSPSLKICFRYTSAELAALGDDPANFLIQTWRNHAWESLPTTPESDSGSGVAGRVCAPVDHLTLFGLFAGDGNTPAGGVAGVKYLPETGLRSVILPIGGTLALGGLALVAIALVIVWRIRRK